MKNENIVELRENGLIFAKYTGKQTSEKLKDTKEKLKKLTDEKKEKGELALWLLDDREIGSMSPDFLPVIYPMKDYKFDRLAVICKQSYIENLIDFFLGFTNLEKKVKVFEDMDEARNWLLEIRESNS